MTFYLNSYRENYEDYVKVMLNVSSLIGDKDGCDKFLRANNQNYNYS